MQQLKQLYRSNYSGEQVVTELRYEGGDWNPTVEMVPNSVFTTHTTTQAIAVGNGESRIGFDMNLIATHKAGFGGANRLQSYGCNAIYRDFAPDFLIVSGDVIAEEIAGSGYCDNNIAYANSDLVLRYPGKFYLIPQNLFYDTGALAAYMACFDGHQKVFLMGYDSYDIPGPVNNVYKDTNGYLPPDEMQDKTFWGMSLSNVVKAYPSVDFVRVMPTANWWIPEDLQPLTNFRQIDTRAFVLEADIG